MSVYLFNFESLWPCNVHEYFRFCWVGAISCVCKFMSTYNINFDILSFDVTDFDKNVVTSGSRVHVYNSMTDSMYTYMR
jgi:hypothetical protein